MFYVSAYVLAESLAFIFPAGDWFDTIVASIGNSPVVRFRNDFAGKVILHCHM